MSMSTFSTMTSCRWARRCEFNASHSRLSLTHISQLCENIIKALRAMNCPAPLQAHQVQGKDWAAIYPVVQWLVRKVLENREATGDDVRLASEAFFSKSFNATQLDGNAATDSSFLDEVRGMRIVECCSLTCVTGATPL